MSVKIITRLENRKMTPSKKAMAEKVVRELPIGTIFKAHYHYHVRTEDTKSLTRKLRKVVPENVEVFADKIKGCVSVEFSHYGNSYNATTIKTWIKKI